MTTSYGEQVDKVAELLAMRAQRKLGLKPTLQAVGDRADALTEIAYVYNGLKAAIRGYQHAVNAEGHRPIELLDGLVTAADQCADRIGQLSGAI